MLRPAALFVFSFMIFACKSQHKETITFIPGLEYIYYYTGDSTNISKADSIAYKERDTLYFEKVSALLKQNSAFEIAVKPAPGAGFVTKTQTFMELLNTNGFKFLTIDSMFIAEKQRFNVNDLRDLQKSMLQMKEWSRPPDPAIDGEALVFFIKKDGTIKYKESANYLEDSSIPITPISSEKIAEIIEKRKEYCKQKNMNFHIFVGGDNDAPFKFFKIISEALKEKNIYKYKFLDTDSNNNFGESNTLNLFMPKDEGKESKYKISASTLTLLLIKNNKIVAYKGNDIVNAETYSYKQIRKVIMDGLKKFGDNFFVLIKTDIEASYKNSVDILDEMAINNIKRYAMEDLTGLEKEIIKKTIPSTEQ